MCFNTNNTLLVDINHIAPATAQASSNIVRCTLAATAVAVLQKMIEVINVGWAFTLLGTLCSLSAMLYLIDRQYGMSWRVAHSQKTVARQVEVLADGGVTGRDTELIELNEKQKDSIRSGKS